MSFTNLDNGYVLVLSFARRATAVAMALVFLVLLLPGCSTANSLLGGNSRKTAVAEIAWDFAENSVLIEIQADSQLNQHQGEAHTLLLGVYQMEDAAPFYKLVADSAALARGLESGKGGDGFVQFSRYVVVPGQRTILSVDRAQKSKFVGIAAGFYQMNAANSTRLFEVPLTVASEGLVTTTYKAAPAVLALRLGLGAAGITSAQRLNQGPIRKARFEPVPLDGGGKEVDLILKDLKQAADIGTAIRKLDK